MNKLRIIATSDLHGYLFPTDYSEKDLISNLGLSRIASAVQYYRAKGPVILVDNGDSFQGSPLLTYYHDHHDFYKNPVSNLFNFLSYDLINLGNHDFNYGPDRLLDFIKQTKAPVITHNIQYDGINLGKTKIIKKAGLKIAFIGVCTHYIPNWERPEHILDMTFEDALMSMKHEVERVKDQVDFVVGMYHGGFERDLETGIETERLTGENQGFEMSKIEGLDVLITGHQHRSIAQKLHNLPVSQTAFRGLEFAVFEIDLKSHMIDVKIEQAQDYPINWGILKPIEHLEARTQNWLDQKIGHLKQGDLLIYDEFEARIHKHPLVSLLNQIQIEKTGSQLAATALFNGVQGFEQNITVRDLVNTYLYPNTLVVKKMTGKALRDMIDRAGHYFTSNDNGEIIIRERYFTPKPQHYNYDMIDGIDYTIDVDQDKGNRVVSLTYQGKEVKDDDEFTITVNNYRASGGGDYDMVRDSETIKEYSEEMLDILIEYFTKHPSVEFEHHNNIRLINSKNKK